MKPLLHAPLLTTLEQNYKTKTKYDYIFEWVIGDWICFGINAVVDTYLSNGVKYTLYAVRMTTAHMYLKPGNRNRHNYHECVLDP